jgi:hypothetical protein
MQPPPGFAAVDLQGFGGQATILGPSFWSDRVHVFLSASEIHRYNLQRFCCVILSCGCWWSRNVFTRVWGRAFGASFLHLCLD